MMTIPPRLIAILFIVLIPGLVSADLSNKQLENLVLSKAAEKVDKVSVVKTLGNPSGDTTVLSERGLRKTISGFVNYSSFPPASVDSQVALFRGGTGKRLKAAQGSGLAKLSSGVLGYAVPGTDYVHPSGGTLTGAVTLKLDGIGNDRGIATGNVLSLENSTPGTDLLKSQNSPRLRFAGNYWDGVTSQPLVATLGFGDNSSGTNAQLTIKAKRGNGAETSILVLDANGQFGSPIKFAAYDARQTLVLGGQLSNDATATATYNQNSAYSLMYGAGWKTTATAGTQAMSWGQVVAPEIGTANPVGVWKAFYGTNTKAPPAANELMRMEWGDRLGVEFNHNSIAGYTAKFNSPVTATSFTGPLTGEASSAAKLTTPRAINGVAFDGTANITAPDIRIQAGTATTGTTDGSSAGVFFSHVDVTFPVPFSNTNYVISGTGASVGSWISTFSPLSAAAVRIYLSGIQTGSVDTQVIHWIAVQR